MKYLKSKPAILIVLAVSSLNAAGMGFLPLDVVADADAHTSATSSEAFVAVDFQKCLPHKAVPQNVCFLSGGISSDEVREFKSRAKDYLLEIVFVQKTEVNENGSSEEYLADVQLQIVDQKGNAVVNTVTEGPFFLADLPFGTYKVIADHEGVAKTYVVKIAAKKHQRVVFLWPENPY